MGAPLYSQYDALVRAKAAVFDTVLDDKPIALWIGGGGNVEVELIDDDGSSNTFMNVPDGTLLMMSVRRLVSAGTNASNILFCYNNRRKP